MLRDITVVVVDTDGIAEFKKTKEWARSRYAETHLDPVATAIGRGAEFGAGRFLRSRMTVANNLSEEEEIRVRQGRYRYDVHHDDQEPER